MVFGMNTIIVYKWLLQATSYELYPFFAIYLPVKTPEPIVAQLRDAARKAMESPAWQEWRDKQGLEKYVICGADLVKLQQTEMKRWGDVIKKANIEPQ
jgi:tripartite-type tricarboxylate transporter receptor subunit TctC